MKSRLRALYPLLAVVVVGVVASAGPTASWLGRALFDWTGETVLTEQLKGTGALVLLRLTQPSLRTDPMVPIAHTSSKPYGVNTFLEQEPDFEVVEASLDRVQEAGFAWIRQQFPWEDIEIHDRGDFEDRRHEPARSAWEKYDRIVGAAEARGLGVIARLDQPPAWAFDAEASPGVIQTPPTEVSDFGAFAEAVATRYRGRIGYYQIWNEPNLAVEWGGDSPDPAAYTGLLCEASRRIKAADPDAVVLSAALAATVETGPLNLSDLLYLQAMYDEGAGACFDIMSAQAYGLWTGPTDRRVDPTRTNFPRPLLLREILVRNGDASKPIWASEMGWNALPEGFAGEPIYGRVTREDQAAFAVQAYQRAQSEWPWMGPMSYWFLKRASDREADQAFYYFRMLEPDLGPLPVYDSLSELASQAPVLGLGYKQEDHWALVYEGAWEDVLDPDAVLGGYRRSGSVGDRVSFRFSGTDLSVVFGLSGGDVEVVVNGARRALGRAAEVGEVVVAQGLRDAEHTFKMTTLSAGIAIDGVIVRRTPTYPVRRLAIVGLGIAGLLGGAIWLRRWRISRASPESSP
ncbi:MAG: hypothetical protein ACE5NC_02050 [Anaerolineae bacterium]